MSWLRRGLLGLLFAKAIGAQSVVTADSLLQRGSLERAESLYYAAVRVRPRDPVARWALGRYLAGRGAPRVALTLFEEALRFGGDAALIAADLAPLYLLVGDYHALVGLAGSPLSPGERERARWLEAHPSRLVAPDSVMMVAYEDRGDAGYLGRLPIRINGKTVDARIAAGVSGVVISDSAAGSIRPRRFAPRAATRGGAPVIPAVADSVAIGRLAFMNQPIRIETMSASALVGLDMLARLAPTFDPRAGRITLRVGRSVPSSTPGDRFPTWTTASDVRVLQAGGWISLVHPQISRLLAGRAWTFDAKRGQIVVGR